MSELKSLNDIFKNSIFRIPNYQRGYAWEKQQLEDFWDDIVNLPDNKEHYTGVVSLKELTLSENEEELKSWNDSKWLINKDYHCYHIVDGQQRLTTIIILLQAIIEIYREKNDDIDSNIILNDTLLTEIIEQYIVKIKPGSEDIIKTYLFGYEVDKPSDDYLKNRILNPQYEGEINESFYTINLDNAKLFFKEKLNEIYNEDNKSSNNKNFIGIERIFRKVTNKFKFNIYKIEKGFNVNVAFETMNNRGKKLSNLELLKNRLIYIASLLELPNDEAKALIDNINETWKIIYSYLGKDKNKILDDDDFLIAHSYIFFGYIEDIKKSYSQFLLKKYFNQNRIKGEIKENIQIDSEDKEESSEIEEDTYDSADLSNKLGKKDIIDYINSLKSLVPYWYYLHFSKYNTKSEYCEEINNWLTRLYRLEYNYFKPLVLVVLSKKNISEEIKCDILKYIERFIFINFRLDGYQATYSRHIYYKITHQLYLNKIDPEIVIDELNNISQLSQNNVINLDLGTLSTISKLFKNSGFYSWKSIKYFLYEYETYLLNKMDGVTKIISKDYFNNSKRTDMVSVEHIFPQSENNEYWIKQFEKYNLSERNKLRGSLGNLIPLSLSINKKLQDDDFKTKKKRYKIGSYSEMEICSLTENKNKSMWNADLILERGLKLIKFIEERWEFKFANNSDRKKFLGLDFMIKKDDKNKNVTEVINRENNNNYIKESYPDAKDLLHLTVDNKTYATGYYRNNGIIVNKGSKLRLGIKAKGKSMQEKVFRGRENSSIQNNEYVKDVFYDNPSLAANIILGNHKNGWFCWKNSQGKTLDEIVRRKDDIFKALFKNKSEEVINLFNILNDKLLNIDQQIDVKYTSGYIAYRVRQNFMELCINKNELLCRTVNGDLYKTNKDIKRIPETYGWSMDTEFYIKTIDDIDKYWDIIVNSYTNTL